MKDALRTRGGAKMRSRVDKQNEDKRTQRQCRGKDDHSDHETDDWIEIKFVFPCREPDDKAGSDDANVAQGVAQDV